MKIDSNWIESRKESIFQQQSIALARSSLDTVFAEITRLREALEAAEASVAAEMKIREREAPMQGIRYDNDTFGFLTKPRDCLAKIKAVLGKETGT